MEKFVILFALTLAALQVSNGYSIGSLNSELEDFVAQLTKISTQSETIIELADNLQNYILNNLSNNITDAVEQQGANRLLEEFKKIVSEIESETPEESKQCIDKTWEKIIQVTETLEDANDDCVSEARTVEAQTTTSAQYLKSRALDVNGMLLVGMKTCLDIAEDVTEENRPCFEELVSVLSAEIADIEKEKEDIIDEVYSGTRTGMENLNNCLSTVTVDLILSGTQILKNLTKCIQDQEVQVRAIPGVADIIKDLKEKIQTIISIITNLPTSIDQIPDKIQELISKLNIAVISKQLKDEINNIIEDGGRNAEKCRQKADEHLNTLVENAEIAAKTCLDSTDDRVEELTNKVKELAAEAKELLSNFNSELLKCTTDNILNPTGFAKCVRSLNEEYKQKIADLQAKIVEDITYITSQERDILEDVSKCVNEVQIKIVQEGQSLIGETEQCVLNAF